MADPPRRGLSYRRHQGRGGVAAGARRRATFGGYLLAALAWVAPLHCPAQETLFYADFRPMMMGADAQAERLGYSVDIVVEAARRLGRDVKTEYQPFARALRTVAERADAIQVSVFRDPVREPRFQWITRTHNEPIAFLTLAKPIDRLDDARALATIGVARRSGLDNLLTSNGFTNLERVSRPQINAIKLEAGRIDAWAAGVNAATWTWRDKGFRLPLVIGAPLGARDVYVAAGHEFPKDVAARYAQVIAEMGTNGDIDAIIAAASSPKMPR